MSNKYSLVVATIPLFAAVFLIGLSACGGSSKNENHTEHKPRHADPGWVHLFDGETLDGWKIGNFVLQGPVQVDEGSINETTTLKKFENDTWYAIHLKVSSEKIEAWIDGEQVINLATTGKHLSIRNDVAPSKPFGICSWRTTSALRNIRLKK